MSIIISVSYHGCTHRMHSCHHFHHASPQPHHFSSGEWQYSLHWSLHTHELSLPTHFKHHRNNTCVNHRLDHSIPLIPPFKCLGVHLGPSHVHPGPGEAARSCGSLVPPNRLPRTTRNRQRASLSCTTVPPKKPGTNTPSGQLQETSD